MNPSALAQRKEFLMRAALEAAGFQPTDLRKAMTRTREALDAKKVVVATHEGVISDEKEFVDHGTRLEAADRIFKMVPDIYVRNERGGPAGEFVVEVVTMGKNGEKTAVRISNGL